MKKQLSLVFCACLLPALLHALPTAQELSTRQLVGQTIMPRVVIGKHKAFKKAVQNGEVTGFFIKTYEGLITHPHITVKNQTKFTAKQRKKLLQTISDLQTWAQQSPHQIPLLLAIDYEGGTVTSPMYMGLKQMPSNMLLAATGDPQLVADMSAAQAEELRAVGANVSLTPVTDVNSNPQNPIIQTRSFGDQAYNAGQLAAVAAQALEMHGVAAVNKHFPGHGDTTTDSHYDQPVTDLPADKLWKTHVAAFMPSVGISSGMMTSHVIYPALDPKNSAIFSPAIIQGLLREKMGFNGLVFTDGLDMRGVGDKTIEDIVLDGYAAGNDVLLLTGKTTDIKNSVRYPRMAADLVEQDLASSYPVISREQLEKSVQKVLALKARLAVTTPVQTPGFEETSQRVAQAGVTLVRNSKNTVPLSPEKTAVCTVFLAEGIFSTQLETFNTVLEANGRTVNRQFLPVTPSDKETEKALSCVEQSQAVVVGTSHKSTLNRAQQTLVNELLREATFTQKPFVLISLLNPYEIINYSNVPAILAVYGPTQAAMQTAAEIIIGQSPARGKLPVSLPK